MQKNILVFGLISGLVVSALMASSMWYLNRNPEFGHSMLVGYASMVVAFAFIFVGVKNYRDKINGGSVSFGQAFKIGILITLISSSMYVITWAVEYNYFMPDFMENYTALELKKAEEAGATAEEIAAKSSEMDMYKQWYKNPLLFALLTFSEIFPVGLLLSIVCALVLKRKPVVTSPQHN